MAGVEREQLATPIIKKVAGIERLVRRALRDLIGMRSASLVGENLQRPELRLEDVRAGEPVQGGGITVNPRRMAASRRRILRWRRFLKGSYLGTCCRFKVTAQANPGTHLGNRIHFV